MTVRPSRRSRCGPSARAEVRSWAGGQGLILLAALALWGCPPPPDPPPPEVTTLDPKRRAASKAPASEAQAGLEAPAPPEDVPVLRCQAQLREGELVLEVELDNPGDAPVWVSAALPRQAGSAMKMDPELAYVRDEGDQVVVTRRMLAIPDGVEVEAPEVPQWARVGPGGTYRGKMAVPWPLVGRTAYSFDPPPALGTPTTVVCELGVLPAANEKPPRYGPATLESQIRARARVDVKG